MKSNPVIFQLNLRQTQTQLFHVCNVINCLFLFLEDRRADPMSINRVKTDSHGTKVKHSHEKGKENIQNTAVFEKQKKKIYQRRKIL